MRIIFSSSSSTSFGTEHELSTKKEEGRGLEAAASSHPMQNEAPAALPILDSIIRWTDVDDVNVMFTMQEFVS